MCVDLYPVGRVSYAKSSDATASKQRLHCPHTSLFLQFLLVRFWCDSGPGSYALRRKMIGNEKKSTEPSFDENRAEMEGTILLNGLQGFCVLL